jgi:hypothetical protein
VCEEQNSDKESAMCKLEKQLANELARLFRLYFKDKK